MNRNLDDYSKKYQVQPFEPVMIQFRRKKTLELIGITQNSTILEIGCGISPACEWIPSYKYLSILEPSPDFYEIACQKVMSYPNVHLLMATIESLPELGAAPYDLILINSLLHELPNPAQVLKSLKSYCHAGTRILINVPNAHSFHRLLAVTMGIQKVAEELSDFNRTFQQSRVYTLQSLRELAESCGYTVQHLETVFIKPFTHSQMQAMIDQKLMTESLLEGLYRVSNQMPSQGAEIFMIICP